MSCGTTFEEKELQELFAHLTFPLKEKVHPPLKKKKVIVIAGPTAVGKTKHSLWIAQKIGGEIISADSMQVYRKMDIGTAKVTKDERAKVVHYLIDIRDLSERFNVMDFYLEAHKAIRDVFLKGGVPIVVGGTGFYLHALIYGPPQGPASVPELREMLEDEMDEKGAPVLYERLKEFDPDYANSITAADRHKIVRGLEIISLTQQKVSDFPKESPEESPYNFRCWFLYMPKEILYPHIEMRCDEMIAAGLIEEVKQLQIQGLEKNQTAAQAIGYRQCLEFLHSGQTPQDFEKFVAAFKRASRRYAKRQFTWFRQESLFRWLNVENLPVEKTGQTIIQDYEKSF